MMLFGTVEYLPFFRNTTEDTKVINMYSIHVLYITTTLRVLGATYFFFSLVLANLLSI